MNTGGKHMKKHIAVILAALLALAGIIVPLSGTFPVSAETTRDAASLDEALNLSGDTLHFVSEGDYPWVVEGDHARSSNQGVDGVYDEILEETKPCISAVSTTVTANEGDIISFELSVSSETSDRLKFYVDGETVERWSGNVDWIGFSYALTSGTHELAWQYEKDLTKSEGEDTAWLDNVHFGAPLPVQGVELTPAVSVPACRKVQLEWTVLPLGAANKTVYFASNNESIATVDDNGVVRGVSEGAATVSICTEDGSFVASCEVTVTSAQPAVQIYGMLAAESLYYGQGTGVYRQPCTWTTFNDVDPETSVVEFTRQTTADGGETAVAAAEYVDGYVYGFTGYGYSPEEFFRLNFEDLQNGIVEPEYYGAYGIDGNVVLDMAYNYANETMYYIAINAYTTAISLYTVDLDAGESTLVGEITNDDDAVYVPYYYSLAIGTDGTGYTMLLGRGAINYGEGMLCEIDLETAHVTRNIGLTGAENFQQQSMTYDHNTGKIYWSQWISAHGPGNALRCIDPETGASEYMGIINGDGGCEILGMFIPYDANEPDPTPVPPTETPEDPTPAPVPPTADPTDTPNPSTDVPENPTGVPSPTVEPNTPDVPSTGAVSIIGAGIAALIGGACVMLRKGKD